MPIPIFFIRFRKKHGRNPRPDELTLGQRRSLRNCCIQNRDRALQWAAYMKIVNELEVNPKKWHDVLAETPEPTRSMLLRQILEHGPEELVHRMRSVFGDVQVDVDPERWKRVLRESVALE